MGEERKTFREICTLFTELVLKLEARGSLDEATTTALVKSVLEATPECDPQLSTIGRSIEWARLHGTDRGSA